MIDGACASAASTVWPSIPGVAASAMLVAVSAVFSASDLVAATALSVSDNTGGSKRLPYLASISAAFLSKALLVVVGFCR